MSWKQELSKNAGRRTEFALIVLILFFLGDEVIKEGYLFLPSDMLKLGTHESFIAVVLGVLLAFAAARRLRNRNT